MKKIILASALATAFIGSTAYAEDKKPDNEVSFNASVVSDYRYRGISQSRLQPALQGGADYVNNPTGFYAGTWLSTIQWTQDAGGGGAIEWDVYGGIKGEVVKNVSYDVGVLGYIYPSNDLAHVSGFADANTYEVYGQLGFGPAYIKYSRSFSNLFGFVDSKGSGYTDIGANIDISNGYTLVLHAGHQTITNNKAYNYTDYKVGVTKEWVGVTFGLAAVGADSNKAYYYTPAGKYTGKHSLVLSAAKTF